ncbi:hypothetical protein EB796_013517 [Bugula neritina]|uniref:C2H2-type domain-containing protein n=1 Tax=Bugula neritina TaxID=10212 RepID=A0A7J7JRV9_BUGNE|nr:hypothetical protein EB796_013517 [Bugula neritina]
MYRQQEKNLSCESCDYKTADPYKLRTHLKVHTSTEEFSCSQCEYKTNLKSELSKHNLNEHPDVEYKCHQCDLVFKRPGNLKRHLYVHQEKNLHCPHKNCQWKTADPYELKRHEQEHVNGKKHVCETCGYAFYRAFDLKKHKKTHLKVHLCRDCNTVFADSHALACHKRRRHPKVRSLVPTPGDTLTEVSALAAPSREVDSGDREKGASVPLPMGEKYDNSQIVVIPEESSCQPLVLSGGTMATR